MDTKDAFPHIDRLARVISAFGRLYNGFEIVGRENFPQKAPALVVFYHAFMPLDAWYFGLQFYRETGILIRGLGDRWLFKVPGLRWLVENCGGVPGSQENAKRLLREGHFVGVSPGGTREALSGPKKAYTLQWGKRRGFVKLIHEFRLDVVPIFTRNVEELYRSPFVDSKPLQNLYERTRWPLVPVFGLGPFPFPVKLVSHIGPVIPYAPSLDIEATAERIRKGLQTLIDRNRGKTSLIKGLRERWAPRVTKNRREYDPDD